MPRCYRLARGLTVFDNRVIMLSDGEPRHVPIDVRYGANLPHWTRDRGTYFVTFRLIDSLPAGVVERWAQERDELFRSSLQRGRAATQDEEIRFQQLFSERVEAFLDQAHGQCWLRKSRIADLVAGALTHFDGIRYRLHAWCVMPNHVHIAFSALPGWRLEQINHSWKSFTAKAANRLLNRTGAFWQSESYDHLVRDEQDFERIVAYIVQNPKKAQLGNWKWVWAEKDQ